MVVSIGKIRGLSEEMAAQLKAMGLSNSERFLQASGTPAGRQQLAQQLGVATQVVLEWANRSDLARVKGIGSVYSDLLEEAGVDTVRELASRRADNLTAKMQAVNTSKQVAGRAPTLRMVESWIAAAKELPRILEY